jgi:catechol 2,3-dioxygenase-like lactoylglutathione lyase family enzyme
VRISVKSVRSVEIEMADPDRAARFYVDVWKLSEVARDRGSSYLRGSSDAHHVLAIHPANGPGKVRRVVFDAANRDVVDAIYAKVKSTGVLTEEPRSLAVVGDGYGFGFEDPAGRAYAIVTDATRHAALVGERDRPVKIAHINFNDPEPEQLVDFLVEAVGFRVSDRAGRQIFLNCDSPDHSSIVVCSAPWRTLNHLSFEMVDLDAMMRGAGRMIDAGYPIEWGPGRHGCANNTFAYFAGPEEFPLEYTSDVDQIDDTYECHGPDYWAWPPGRLDQWGVTPPHTARWKRLQDLYGFARDAYRLDRKMRERASA